MTVLQVTALALVAIVGTAVVLVPVPLRQALTLALYGFALTILFFSFQAPDVALSEIVVSGVGLPVIILAALRRLADEKPDPESHQEDE
ncbi:MAG TPA: DUF4040 domain-containing protein [Solirubrobacteraceae bacterium]|jgi:uncharacterized MnhB-related membrane protein|nr:DUF4040 domain-containing protein [Solirubrobacteraceae bacterium]